MEIGENRSAERGVNTEPADVTQLLLAWNNGDRGAFDLLMPLVYQELRRVARRHMRAEDAGHSLEATALVNDVYIRLVDQKRVNWQNRAHFFGAAARIIRRLLVEHARARHRLKRGGDALKISLNGEINVRAAVDLDVVALDEALSRLAKFFFAGLSIEETAEALNISPATVKRDWTTARAWLYREMTSNK